MKLFAGISILFFVTLSYSLTSHNPFKLQGSLYKNGLERIQEKPDPKMCISCCKFAQHFLLDLINIIFGDTVGYTCMGICSKLVEKTNSTIAGDICLLLCTSVGAAEFVKLIDKADLDPIYLCELLDVCEVFDNGDMTITSLKVHPQRVKRGSYFNISAVMVSKNGIGTGENIIAINAADGLPLEEVRLLMPQPPGTYNVSLEGLAQPNCDDSQPVCERWIPGNYEVIFVVCNGECGSKHPHSQVYDRKTTNFTVYEDN